MAALPLQELDMQKILLSAISSLALISCSNLSTEQRTVVGLTAGAAAGLVTAEALHADRDWKIIAALVGAAAGTMVAQNLASGECAYSRGDGTFYRAPCR